MAGEVTIPGLAVWAVIGLGCCLFITLAARRYPARRVWTLWAIFVTAAFFLTFGPLLLDPFVRELGLGYTAYFLSVMLGLPSATAVWVALRRASRGPPGHVLLDFGVVTASLVVALPFAIVLTAVPDFVTLFR